MDRRARNLDDLRKLVHSPTKREKVFAKQAVMNAGDGERRATSEASFPRLLQQGRFDERKLGCDVVGIGTPKADPDGSATTRRTACHGLPLMAPVN
jgi:hypothetical protein